MNYKKALQWTLVLAALTPIFFFNGTFYPYMLGKSIFFKTLVELAVILFSVSLLRGESFRFDILKRKVLWLPALFLCVASLASLFGVSPSHSFWSLFDRMDGLLQLVHLVVYFYLLLISLGKAEWRKLLAVTAIAASVAALHGIGQKIGFPGLTHSGIDRAEGTIGNAAFLGGYLSLSVFITVFLAYTRTAGWRVWWYVLAAIQALALIFTYTRGAWVGVGAALAFGAALALWKGTKRARIAGGVLLGVGLLSLLLIVGFRDTLKTSNVYIVSRLAQISLTDPTTLSRLFVWGNTLREVDEAPLLGVGPENFEVLYNKFFDPQIVTEEWFDRAHNMYIDVLASTGLLGLALYLALLGALAVSLVRAVRRDPLTVILLLGFVAYAVQNIFVFESVSTGVLFWGFAAYVFAAESRGDDAERKAALSTLAKLVLGALILASAIAPYYFSWKPLRANLLLSEGYKYQIVDTDRSLAALEKGIALDTFAEIEYGYQLYNIYFTKVSYGKLTEAELQSTYDLTVAHLTRMTEKYPDNARMFVYLGHVLEGRPQGVVLAPGFQERILRRAIELSPKRPQAYYMLANMHLSESLRATDPGVKAREQAMAADILEEYLELVPRYSEAQAIYASILLGAGRRPEADAAIAKAREYYTGEPSVAKRIVSYLLRTERMAESESYFEAVIAAEPDNYEYKFDLAKVYFINKRYEKAVELLNEVNAARPDILEREPYNVSQILRGYNKSVEL
jgi:O-antigen ligase